MTSKSLLLIDGNLKSGTIKSGILEIDSRSKSHISGMRLLPNVQYMLVTSSCYISSQLYQAF